MDSEFQFNLSKRCLSHFPQDLERFNEAVKKELSTDDFSEILRPFVNDGRDDLTEESIEVNGVSIDHEGKGRVYFTFEAYRGSGCKSEYGPIEYHKPIRCQLDAEQETLTLLVDYPPDRDPDTY